MSKQNLVFCKEALIFAHLERSIPSLSLLKSLPTKQGQGCAICNLALLEINTVFPSIQVAHNKCNIYDNSPFKDTVTGSPFGR